ncbi:MAG: methyltransferase domain-containing protein [Deltaproteobacteria bacterium]|nr:methyltransferase domain-containing protein [Deltaproteobacteria bacterium]
MLFGVSLSEMEERGHDLVEALVSEAAQANAPGRFGDSAHRAGSDQTAQGPLDASVGQAHFGWADGPVRLLEAGCGSGGLLTKLARRLDAKAVGVDPYAVPRLEDPVVIERLPGEEIDRIEGRFHVIFSVMSLHHMTRPEAFFRAARSIAAWRSTLVIVDWKDGVDTGIPEQYFEPAAVSQMAIRAGCTVEVAREDRWHFMVTARPRTSLLAVAADDQGAFVPATMFGQAPQFVIFEVNETLRQARRIEVRPNPHRHGLQHEKTLDVWRLVQDCAGLLSSRVGSRGVERLVDRGVALFQTRQRMDMAEALRAVGLSLV